MHRTPNTSPAALLHACYLGDGLDRLDAIHDLIEDLGQQQDHAALLARSESATWDEIGYAVGITRQAAQQRWGRIAARIERRLDLSTDVDEFTHLRVK